MTIDDNEAAGMTGGWDLGSLPSNVRLGQGCSIENKQAFGRFRSERDPGLILGRDVTVYTWTAFNVEPTGVVEVGDGSTLVGPTFMCAERISIGQRVVISYDVTIADSDFHPEDPEARIQDSIANAPSGDKRARPGFVTAPVVIGDDVSLGIGAIVLKGVRIGKGAVVRAGSVVTRDVPAGSVVEGNPARVVEAGTDPE